MSPVQYLLDTVAISEAVKSRSDQGYMHWLNSTEDTQLFVSCLTIGEIQKGITLAKDPVLGQKLNDYLAGLYEAFDKRILNIDVQDSLLWGQLSAKAQQVGKTPPAVDALLAAQCLQRQMVLVTRNVKDFRQFAGLEILCPWSG